jgi:hypothetical protein
LKDAKGRSMVEESDNRIDTSRFTNADWAALEKLRDAHAVGGKEAVKAAMREIERTDLVAYIRIIGAYFPDHLREVLRDAMFERGMTAEELRELIQQGDIAS